MKVKGISVFEEHVEKLVIVLFGLIFLGVFALQFVGSPNAVQVGGKTIAPADAGDEVQALADRASASFDYVAADRLPPRRGGDAGAPLDVRLAEASNPRGIFGSPSDLDGVLVGATPEQDAPLPPTDLLYVVPNPPAPASVVAAAYGGTIDPFELTRYPDLAALMPAQQPYDKHFASVEASFDAAAFRKLLAAAPDSDDELAVPARWAEQIELLRVELIRREIGSDGSPGAAETVAAMPGRRAFDGLLEREDILPAELPRIRNIETQARETIRRPPFYGIISGDHWVWPSAMTPTEVDPEVMRERDRLLRQRNALLREIENIKRRLGEDEAPGRAPGRGANAAPLAEPFDDLDEIRWPDLPGTWVAQFGGPGPAGPRPEETREDRDAEREQQLRDRLAEKEEQLRAVEAQLEELGFRADGSAIADPQQDRPRFFVAENEGHDLPLMDPQSEQIRIWAHDITAQPGQTYEYALRVWVTNPLFGRARQVADAQRELAEDAVLVGELSPWSDPVTIDRPTRYFVTSAREAGEAFGSTTSSGVEVYRFFYGHWRRGDVTLAPGDSLRTTIELPEDHLPIFEVEMGSQGPEVVGRTMLDPAELAFERDAFLLDVATSPGGRADVFLRDVDGAIVVRQPGTDGASSVRERMANSAILGETAVVREPGSVAGPPRGGAGGGPGGAPSRGVGSPRERPSGGGDENFEKPGQAPPRR